jgi:hypothetical protein
MPRFRQQNPVVRARGDDTFEVVLHPQYRAILVDASDSIGELLENPDEPMLERLLPTTYPDDPEREAGYRLLAGEELRVSHRAAIDVLREVFDEGTATAEQLWAAIRALNSIRLVTGTLLGIETEDDRPDLDLDQDDPTFGMWAIYELSVEVQHFIVKALDP